VRSWVTSPIERNAKDNPVLGSTTISKEPRSFLTSGEGTMFAGVYESNARPI
jgi:hypothetical protein